MDKCKGSYAGVDYNVTAVNCYVSPTRTQPPGRFFDKYDTIHTQCKHPENH